MYVVTAKKPFEEIEASLGNDQKVYIIGCGTCATACHTGGKEEVLELKERLEGTGREVIGWMIVPTVCDEATTQALEGNRALLGQADGLLVTSCAFGVQRVASAAERPTYPGLDTLFIGLEDRSGNLSEVCRQCGQCVLAGTGGVCPVVTCTKGLVNGPCGGTNNGKCEVDSEKDCAWTLIYQRLEKLGQLDRMRQYQPPKNWQAVVRPGKLSVR